ncbi:hypothetical protein LXL04_016439 [Taraxacum kok-saghyz]
MIMRGEREKREASRRSAARARKEGQSWANRMKMAATGTRTSSPLKSDNLGGKATTFFFTNFPEHWNEAKLWKEFRRVGMVVDVFVARKRDKAGRKFGFTRFMKVLDIGKMEIDLNNIWMEKFRLRANVAKYGRHEEKDNQVPEHPQKIRSIIIGQNSQEEMKPESSKDGAKRQELTYAAVVHGNKSPHILKVDDPAHPPPSGEKNMKSIHVIPTKELLENLKKTLIGEVHSYGLLKNLSEFTTVEGLTDAKAAKNYLHLARSSWKNWFKHLKSWSPEANVRKWLTSLTIIGIPPHAWLSSTFTEIGLIWGEVVTSEWCNPNSNNKERGKITILTQAFSLINETVEIVIGNEKYRVMVMEDLSDSENLGPNPPHQTDTTDNDSGEEKEENNADSLCDENSEFDFAGEEDIDPAMTGNDELPEKTGTEELPEKGDRYSTPARKTSKSQNNSSFPGNTPIEETMIEKLHRQGVQRDGSSPKTASLDGSYNSTRSSSPWPFMCESEPNSSPIIKLNVEPTITPISIIYSDHNLSPTMDHPILFNQKIDTLVSETTQNSIKLLNTQLLEHLIEDSKENNIDIEEEQMDVSTLFWENKATRLKKLKRDLKMKRIQSPCKCRTKIKKNGENCRHAINAGNVKRSPIIIAREDEDSSDSETFIRYSNKRNLKKLNISGSSLNTEALISAEATKINEVGNAIGVNLEGFENHLKGMETKSDNLGEFDVKTIWGFSHYSWAASPSIGNSGGLLSIWDPNFVEINLVETSRHCIITSGTWKHNKQLMGIINVYAPQDDQGKQDLWDYITNAISNDCDRMWTVCGDFNEVRCPKERRGPAFILRGAQKFNIS